MTLHSLRLRWSSVPDFSGAMEELLPRLSAEEQQRAARFRISEARHRFILARVMLRHQLGKEIGIVPESVFFATGKHGKPRLDIPGIEDPSQFNLSHSGDVVVFVVGSVDVGVDVESLRDVPNAERMARRFFSPSEQSVIQSLGGATRYHAFLRIWTQKEAFLKATGLGFGMPLREVETEPDPAAPPGLRAIAGDKNEAANWTLLEVEIPDAVCTVALRGPAAELEVQRFTPVDLT